MPLISSVKSKVRISCYCIFPPRRCTWIDIETLSLGHSVDFHVSTGDYYAYLKYRIS